MYKDFISKIEILESLSDDEQLKICDCLEKRVYSKGEVVITRGETGTNFYLLQEGTADAHILNPETQKGMFRSYFNLIKFRGNCAVL